MVLPPIPDVFPLLQVQNGLASVIVFVVSKNALLVEEVQKYWEPVQEARQKWKRSSGKKVPIILVVTGLENENPDSNVNNLDGWWTTTNGDLFKDNGITPDEVACVTALRGKFQPQTGRHVNDPLYRASREKILWLIAKCINGLEEQVGIGQKQETFSRSRKHWAEAGSIGQKQRVRRERT